MDRLKKQRVPITASTTNAINQATLEFAKVAPEVPDKKILLACSVKLRSNREKLKEVDQRILDLLLDDDVDDAVYELESNQIEDRQDRLTACEMEIETLLTPPVVVVAGSTTASTVSESNFGTAHTDDRTKRKTYKLPKVEVKQFNGNILDWLSWWQQFERIHQDDELHEADKFQYLSQAMVEKSKAAELIKVYKQTAANYPKAVKALQDRFGKPKILKRVYVRELLSMINNNSREIVKISSVYDRIEAHLKALESLEVTPDQMDVILFPMVESCLPEDILVAW
jgi:acyl transferase domain-containing protein